ncbi:GerAB/ArcD/ProY family transporter [Paenalkalicoccus suaedae]|uniref:GerAB/ArcD/ProY family transporter n=1 Tax=Paenalkalicoccus suaedae TaxID=2592382 RepID=A0A859FF18_9BACI|nr:GerAB/ArcD/ProY family transporter [Paenalkalicoccus suaedae]QKS70815.1 GerAB/ArcD/ProY family transporter [Paenalkalicoccus suaedae]
MSISQNHFISPNQLLFFIIQTQIGIAILQLPIDMFKIVKWEGWIAVIISGFCLQLLALSYLFIVSRWPQPSFFTLTKKGLGNIIGNIVNFLYFVYFIIVGTHILTLYYETISVWLFPETPKLFILLLIVIAAVYLVQEDLQLIARFYGIVSILLILIIVVQLTSYSAAQPLNLLPLGLNSPLDYIKASTLSIQSMLGFEIVLFLYPYLKGEYKKIKLMTVFAIGITTTIYVFTIISSYLFFSPDEILLIPHPVLYMLKAFTSSFVDRLDLLFISVWIVSVSTSFMTYLFLASLYVKNTLPIKRRKPAVPFVALIMLIVAMQYESNLEIEAFGDFMHMISPIFFLLLPLILGIAVFIRAPKKEAMS